jgi:2-oxo-4-hydroxy-4-carboxy-5-ureidoimidazoline decarboxylase
MKTIPQLRPDPMEVQGASDLSRAEFTEQFGALFEHSPWVAATAFDYLPKNENAGNVDKLHACFESAVMNATPQRQLRLLNAHPQLAVAASINSELTADSRMEQAGAGLDQCSPDEFEQFGRLNDEYAEKFGFPFIVAVKGLEKTQILGAFRQRLSNQPEAELKEALRQVCQIGKFRLVALLNE